MPVRKPRQRMKSEPIWPVRKHRKRAETDPELISLASSYEAKDSVIDDRWFVAVMPQRMSHEDRVHLDDTVYRQYRLFVDGPGADRSFLERWYDNFNKWLQKRRIAEQFESDRQAYIMAKLFRMDGIFCDEQTRLLLLEYFSIGINSDVDEKKDRRRQIEHEIAQKQFGEELLEWAEKRSRVRLDNPGLMLQAERGFKELVAEDPLWQALNSPDQLPLNREIMLNRMRQLGNEMANRMVFDFSSRPMHPSTRLTKIQTEFDHFNVFFELNVLPEEEFACRVFKKNLDRCRESDVECFDHSRVKLNEVWMDENSTTDLLLRPTTHRGHCRIPQSDFIHANFVSGGPFLNTFICAQAPMTDTIENFWQMVLQEKVGMIIMLCGTKETGKPKSTVPLERGTMLRLSSVIVENLGVDHSLDPLFVVTRLRVSLDLRCEGIRTDSVVLEHWQWDWRDFTDHHWPFRVLRRARQFARPTLVHCIKGCGRTGTLVTIECLLMQLMRGTMAKERNILQNAIFVALQRKCIIETPLQWMFIYRCLLHFMSPYLTSWWDRFRLGLFFEDSIATGFLANYNQLVRAHYNNLMPD